MVWSAYEESVESDIGKQVNEGSRYDWSNQNEFMRLRLGGVPESITYTTGEYRKYINKFALKCHSGNDPNDSF